MPTEADFAEKCEILATLFGGWAERRGSASEHRVRAYLIAAEDYSVAAIEAAMRRFVKAGVPGHSRAFVPTAAEFAAECELQERALAQTRTLRSRDLRVGKAQPDYSIEHRREVQRKFGLLARSLANGERYEHAQHAHDNAQ